MNGVIIAADFGNGLATWRQNVMSSENVGDAIKEQASILFVKPWHYRYLFWNGKAVKTICGPDLDGCSLEFVSDYFQKSVPYYENPSQGDAKQTIIL